MSGPGAHWRLLSPELCQVVFLLAVFVTSSALAASGSSGWAAPSPTLSPGGHHLASLGPGRTLNAAALKRSAMLSPSPNSQAGQPLTSVGTPASVPPPTVPPVYSVSVGTYPEWSSVAYDDGWVYVPNEGSRTVSVINGTSVVGTVPVGTDLYSTTYDSANHFTYISNLGSANVSVLNGTKIVGSVKTGTDPYYASFDSANGYVYVPNEGTSSVTVINGTKVVATVTVGLDPVNTTFDPSNGHVYVEDEGASRVSVINNTTVIATLTVGSEPWSGIYDSENGYVYVPNAGSDTVSVIDNNTVLASPRVGSYPRYGGYDNRTGLVYIANQDSSNVSVLNGTTIVASISTGAYPVAAAFNPGNGYMYVPGAEYPHGLVDLIQGTTVVATVGDGYEAQNAVFDATNGAVYIPNLYSYNVSVILADNLVTFNETGLPAGTTWQITLTGGTSNSSSSNSLTFVLPTGVYQYTVATTNLTFANPGGFFTVLSKPVSVTVRFAPFTYSVSFTETGLPAERGGPSRWEGSRTIRRWFRRPGSPCPSRTGRTPTRSATSPAGRRSTVAVSTT